MKKNVLSTLKEIKRSRRGELEISSLNNLYLKLNKLKYFNLGRGITWFDMGTPEKIFDVSEFIKLIEKKRAFQFLVCNFNMNKKIKFKDVPFNIPSIFEKDFKKIFQNSEKIINIHL